MVTAITGRAAEGGKTSAITRLESAEAAELGMLPARTDISGGQAKLETSLRHLWNAWVSSEASVTMTGNTLFDSHVNCL